MSSVLIFFFIALISEIVGTIGGFGSSVFFVPVAQWLFDFKSVLMLTALLHNFSNTSKIILFYKGIDYKLLLLYGLPSVIMVITGAYLTNYISFKYSEIILGVFIILFSVFVFFKPQFQLPVSNRSAIAGGSVAGFLAGLIGTGGAIRGMSLAAFNLQKNTFIATSAAIDFFVDLSRTFVYAYNGYFKSEHWVHLPFLLIAAFVGSYIGKIMLQKVSQDYFRRIVLLLLLIIGITMILKPIIKY